MAISMIDVDDGGDALTAVKFRRHNSPGPLNPRSVLPDVNGAHIEAEATGLVNAIDRQTFRCPPLGLFNQLRVRERARG